MPQSVERQQPKLRIVVIGKIDNIVHLVVEAEQEDAAFTVWNCRVLVDELGGDGRLADGLASAVDHLQHQAVPMFVGGEPVAVRKRAQGGIKERDRPVVALENFHVADRLTAGIEDLLKEAGPLGCRPHQDVTGFAFARFGDKPQAHRSGIDLQGEMPALAVRAKTVDDDTCSCPCLGHDMTAIRVSCRGGSCQK